MHLGLVTGGDSHEATPPVRCVRVADRLEVYDVRAGRALR